MAKPSHLLFFIIVCIIKPTYTFQCLDEVKKSYDPRAKTVQLVEAPWLSVRIENEIVKILANEVLGNPVEIILLETFGHWDSISTGKTHAFLEVWPNSEDDYIKEYISQKKTVINAGPLGTIGQVGWFTQQFVLEQYPQVANVQVLRDPAVSAIFNNTFYYADPTWVINDQEIASKLGLDLNFVPLFTEEALIEKIIDFNNKSIPMLFYFWSPHWLFYEVNLTQLYVPAIKGKSYYLPTILQKIMSSDLREYSNPVASLISGFTINGAEQAKLMSIAKSTNNTHAACTWVKENNVTWQYWIEHFPELDYLDYNSPQGVIVLVISILVQFLLLAFMVLTVIKRHHPYFKAGNVILLTMILTGAIIMSVSVYLIIHTSKIRCYSSIFFFGLGFTFMWTSVLQKEYTIYKIFQKARRMKKYKFTTFKALQVYGLVLGIELLICLLWVFLSPPKQYEFVCDFSTSYWAVIYLCYKVGLLVAGCLLAYVTRKKAKPYSESRYLGIGVFSFSLVIVLTLVLYIFLPGKGGQFSLHLGIELSIFSLVSPTFVNKLYKVFTTDELVATADIQNQRMRASERTSKNHSTPKTSSSGAPNDDSVM